VASRTEYLKRLGLNTLNDALIKDVKTEIKNELTSKIETFVFSYDTNDIENKRDFKKSDIDKLQRFSCQLVWVNMYNQKSQKIRDLRKRSKVTYKRIVNRCISKKNNLLHNIVKALRNRLKSTFKSVLIGINKTIKRFKKPFQNVAKKPQKSHVLNTRISITKPLENQRDSLNTEIRT